MLSGEEIARLGIVSPGRPLLPAHIQPNGVDLSVATVWRFRGAGLLGVAEGARELPGREEVELDGAGWMSLGPGAYGFQYAEEVALPTDCAGLVLPRSSLLRMGVHVPTAVWDAGYRGRAQGLLVVLGADGLRLQRGARVAQLVVFRLSAPTTGYSGRYQGENLPRRDESG